MVTGGDVAITLSTTSRTVAEAMEVIDGFRRKAGGSGDRPLLPSFRPRLG